MSNEHTEELKTVDITPSKRDELTYNQAISVIKEYSPMVDLYNGLVVSIDVDGPADPGLNQASMADDYCNILLEGEELRESEFFWEENEDGNFCLVVGHENELFKLSAFQTNRIPRSNEHSAYLDPDARYLASDITAYLNSLGSDVVNDDSYVQINAGSLMPGDFVIHLDMGGGMWLYVYEQYLNAWASCYRVKYINDAEMPESMLVDCRDKEEGGEA